MNATRSGRPVIGEVLFDRRIEISVGQPPPDGHADPRSPPYSASASALAGIKAPERPDRATLPRPARRWRRRHDLDHAAELAAVLGRIAAGQDVHRVNIVRCRTRARTPATGCRSSADRRRRTASGIRNRAGAGCRWLRAASLAACSQGPGARGPGNAVVRCWSVSAPMRWPRSPVRRTIERRVSAALTRELRLDNRRERARRG